MGFLSGNCTVFRRVLVVGIGALGSELVKNLGLLNCERVFVADPDRLEEKNIARSLLMRDGAPGESKVNHAIAKLQASFPRTEWHGAVEEIADVAPEEFEHAEMLFSCVDTDLARMEIAALAARYRLPVCDAGLGGMSTRVGRVSWFPAGERAACFACLLGERRRAELMSTWESTIHACWAGSDTEERAWTSTPTMASVVAGLQAEFALSSAVKETVAFSVHLDLDGNAIARRIRHGRSTGCPLHEEVDGVVFPMCTLAECRTCGKEFSPNRRVAWVRRRGACPSCGSRSLMVRNECAVKGAGQQWVKLPPGNWFVPPGSNRSSRGGNEAAEASGVKGREGDLASRP
jgi:molybdopterin/thiamine biosynthesis adenylyltransferase